MAVQPVRVWVEAGQIAQPQVFGQRLATPNNGDEPVAEAVLDLGAMLLKVGRELPDVPVAVV
ncbi:hypothetical protein [Micromonospora pisi]|uniref:hypothetical protein n=1 Tax=Micromonospora pisi TaxID=589240 RepID=UPI000EB3EE82|nr:hypothetical protein [Micromonospora pisi]